MITIHKTIFNVHKWNLSCLTCTLPAYLLSENSFSCLYSIRSSIGRDSKSVLMEVYSQTLQHLEAYHTVVVLLPDLCMWHSYLLFLYSHQNGITSKNEELLFCTAYCRILLPGLSLLNIPIHCHMFEWFISQSVLINQDQTELMDLTPSGNVWISIQSFACFQISSWISI